MTRPAEITPEWVGEQVTKIMAHSTDDERAHSEEDALHQTVLEAIACGTAVDPAECAKRALATQRIQFFRWCA